MKFVKVPEAVRCHRLWPPVFALFAPTLQLQHNHRAIYQYTQARKCTFVLPNPQKGPYPFLFTSLFKCRSQREEIGSEETKMSVLHMISYDWDQPAAWELQVIAEERKKSLLIC